MKKLKIILGVTWAFIGLILIIILFPGLNGFSASVSKLPFMKIHPRFSGGEVAKQVVSDACTLSVRKPVFKGLTGDRMNGFVQVDWRGNLPEKIMDTIDYNLDGKPDFNIFIDTKTSKTEIEKFNNTVREVRISTPASYGWAVRVNLHKPETH